MPEAATYALPLTVSREALLDGGSDRRFRSLVSDLFTISAQMEIVREQTMNDAKNKGKPENIIDKIIEGRMKTWLAANVLLEQPFVKDDTKTVGQLLAAGGLKLVKFVRYKVGEIS